MLYRELTSMDSTMGRDMDSTRGENWPVFHKGLVHRRLPPRGEDGAAPRQTENATQPKGLCGEKG